MGYPKDADRRSTPTSSTETLVEKNEAPYEPPNVEKLGRQRPEAFSSTIAEVAFVACMLISLAMAEFIMGGFQVVLPALIEPFDIPPESQTWPSSVFTLVAGAFLFPFGRLADMYGGYLVFNAGMMWCVTWTVIAGFSTNFIMLVLCRAMEGLGASAYMTAGISLLGSTYRPGPRKNFVFSLYGAVAPMGFFSGILVGGTTQSLLSWRWYFWIGGIIAGVCNIGCVFFAPRDYDRARRLSVRMDWLGFCTIVPGLMLVVYAITDSAHAPGGWASPQILVTFIIGLLFLAAAVFVEGWVAESPLVPADIFKVRYMKRMLLCLFLTWGVFATYLFYANFYIETVLDKSPLLTAVWFAPWAASGLVLALTSGLILHVLPGRLLLIISGVSKVLAMLLFALMPSDPNYWAWVLPAMVAEAACCDVLFTVSNVYLTTSLPRHRQGLAGALINVTVFLGGAFFLAVMELAIVEFEDIGMSLREQYKGVFWIGVGVAGVALVICFFIKLGKAGCALPTEEEEKRIDDEAGLEAESSSDEADKPVMGTAAGEAMTMNVILGRPTAHHE